MPKKLADWSLDDIAPAADQVWCEATNMRSNSAEKVSTELQMFHGDVVAGKRPTLVLMAKPQQGKTSAAAAFIAWAAGQGAAFPQVTNSRLEHRDPPHPANHSDVESETEEQKHAKEAG